jgi:hypothetical protein
MTIREADELLAALRVNPTHRAVTAIEDDDEDQGYFKNRL